MQWQLLHGHVRNLTGKRIAQARRIIGSAMQPGAAQKALSMHVESFWQRHSTKIVALGAALLLYVLWCALPLC